MSNVRAGNIIDAIEVVYGNKTLPAHGGRGGGANNVSIPAGDVLQEVTGYYGIWYGKPYILQIQFKTREGRIFGPYGTMAFAQTRTPFTFSANPDEQIIAFHGSTTQGVEADGSWTYYVTSLGVSLKFR